MVLFMYSKASKRHPLGGAVIPFGKTYAISAPTPWASCCCQVLALGFLKLETPTNHQNLQKASPIATTNSEDGVRFFVDFGAFTRPSSHDLTHRVVLTRPSGRAPARLLFGVKSDRSIG